MPRQRRLIILPPSKHLKISGIIATIFEQRVKDQRDVWDLLHELNIPFLGTLKKSADAPRAVYKGLFFPTSATPQDQVIESLYKQTHPKPPIIFIQEPFLMRKISSHTP